MKHVVGLFGLVLLLLVAQQGAVVHDMSHVEARHAAAAVVGDSRGADEPCALCPVFAQASAPAFSHAFWTPILDDASLLMLPAPMFTAVEASAPRARSRGPPRSG